MWAREHRRAISALACATAVDTRRPSGDKFLEWWGRSAVGCREERSPTRLVRRGGEAKNVGVRIADVLGREPCSMRSVLDARSARPLPGDGTWRLSRRHASLRLLGGTDTGLQVPGAPPTSAGNSTRCSVVDGRRGASWGPQGRRADPSCSRPSVTWAGGRPTRSTRPGIEVESWAPPTRSDADRGQSFFPTPRLRVSGSRENGSATRPVGKPRRRREAARRALRERRTHGTRRPRRRRSLLDYRIRRAGTGIGRGAAQRAESPMRRRLSRGSLGAEGNEDRALFAPTGGRRTAAGSREFPGAKVAELDTQAPVAARLRRGRRPAPRTSTPTHPPR